MKKLYDAKRTKILAIKMPSRMKRGKIKKIVNPNNKATPEEVEEYYHTNIVYIQYRPLAFGRLTRGLDRKEKKCDIIKGYICTCKNGRRLTGVCSHVATVIYYLSNAQFTRKNKRKYPADYLNQIFNDIRKRKNPRYIKSKRLEKNSDSGSSSDNSSDEDPDWPSPQLPSSPSQQTAQPPTQPLPQTTPQPPLQPTPRPPIVPHPNNTVEGFVEHKPIWGGRITYANKTIRLINTCSCDNLQFALWVLSKLQYNFHT